MSDTDLTRLCVYNGGLLSRRPVRRMIEHAGYDVTTGVPVDGDWVGIWGRSPTSWRGEAVADWADAPVLTVEDAFLRSVQPGRVGGEDPAGLVLDRTGVHFDSSVPCDLENLLRTEALDDTPLLDRARRAIEQIKHWELGKYSDWVPEAEVPEPGYVLVVDQTEGDAALMGAGPEAFHEMLVAAAEEHPGNEILVKVHPETRSGARRGHFGRGLPVPRARIFDAPVSNWRLLEGAVGVYTHSSLLGFEAIFAGHTPRVFGGPFYAGWGLTVDFKEFPRRDRRLSRAQLFAGAMILYPHWFDPVMNEHCEIEDVIAALAARARAWREDRGGYRAYGFSRWKRPFVRRAFGGNVRFEGFSKSLGKSLQRNLPPRKLMAWGAAEAPEGALRVEDGVLRSKGLGAALVPPLSLAVDDLGLYFDPTKPSRLDSLVAASRDLPDAEIQRAERLLTAIRGAGLTKYNIQADVPALPGSGSVVLVVGQVEDDASVLLGAGSEIRTNIDLLRAARASRPDARILWKPHPDVEAGLRRGTVAEADMEGFADIALVSVGADAAIAMADEVWTMTSTLGFEALIRGKRVTCTGLPFYAGWGLTDDRMPPPAHRGRTVSLAGLAHAVLIGYPRYFHPSTGAALSAEQAVALLARGEVLVPPSRFAGVVQRLWTRLRRR